jgi:hypothetical protein
MPTPFLTNAYEIGHVGGVFLIEPLAYSVDKFCSLHGISLARLRRLWKKGLGPRTMQVDGLTLISREAAVEWRRQMEELSSAQEVPHG